MGLFYIRVNVKTLVTGSIKKRPPNSTLWHHHIRLRLRLRNGFRLQASGFRDGLIFHTQFFRYGLISHPGKQFFETNKMIMIKPPEKSSDFKGQADLEAPGFGIDTPFG
jgi:hypothetical protein